MFGFFTLNPFSSGQVYFLGGQHLGRKRREQCTIFITNKAYIKDSLAAQYYCYGAERSFFMIDYGIGGKIALVTGAGKGIGRELLFSWPSRVRRSPCAQQRP